MKSYGMTLNLRDDSAVIAKYKEYHRAVWPEVLAGLRRKRAAAGGGRNGGEGPVETSGGRN